MFNDNSVSRFYFNSKDSVVSVSRSTFVALLSSFFPSSKLFYSHERSSSFTKEKSIDNELTISLAVTEAGRQVTRGKSRCNFLSANRGWEFFFIG